MVSEAYADTLKLLHANIDALKCMADALMQVETIDHSQVENIIKYGSLKAPEEQAPAKTEESAVPPAEEPKAPEQPVKKETEDDHIGISPWGNVISDNKE